MSRLSRSERSKNRRWRNPLATSLTAQPPFASTKCRRCWSPTALLAHPLRDQTIAAPPYRHDGNHPRGTNFAGECGSRAALGPPSVTFGADAARPRQRRGDPLAARRFRFPLENRPFSPAEVEPAAGEVLFDALEGIEGKVRLGFNKPVVL